MLEKFTKKLNNGFFPYKSQVNRYLFQNSHVIYFLSNRFFIDCHVTCVLANRFSRKSHVTCGLANRFFFLEKVIICFYLIPHRLCWNESRFQFTMPSGHMHVQSTTHQLKMLVSLTGIIFGNKTPQQLILWLMSLKILTFKVLR